MKCTVSTHRELFSTWAPGDPDSMIPPSVGLLIKLFRITLSWAATRNADPIRPLMKNFRSCRTIVILDFTGHANGPIFISYLSRKFNFVTITRRSLVPELSLNVLLHFL